MVKMMQRFKHLNETYHAIFLVLGTSRFFLLADFLFIYDLVIDPVFSGKKIPKPSKEIIGIVVLVVLTALYAPNPNDGLQTAVRIYVLAAVLPSYKYGFRYKQTIGFTISLLALFAISQTLFMNRSIGIHMNASMLGQTALVVLPMLWFEVGLAAAIILTVSISRSSLLTFMVFAVAARNKYLIRLAAITALMFIVFAAISAPQRITFGGMVSGLDSHISTVSGLDSETIDRIDSYDDRCGEYRAAKFTWIGYGYSGYCESTGQPRPHNIFVLSAYELGIFSVPFWGLIIFAARRLNWLQIFPLIILGMFTEELFGRPEGIYLIALWIISTNILIKKRVEFPHT